MDLGTAAAALAGGATVAAYLNAKFHIKKDVSALWALKRAERIYSSALAREQGNPWFVFLETVKRYPDMTCLWTRERSYTYREVLEQACQYANFFLESGVQKGDLVGFYLQNRAEFIIAWIALWSIGCAPAAINYNLTGDALVHCLKISGAKITIVDEDPICTARIEECNHILSGELGMKMMTLDESLKATIRASPATLPPKDLAMKMSGEFPSILLYTSGTTGMPKGCAFTMARLYTTLYLRRHSLGDKDGPDGDRWYSCMPLYHGTAAMSLISCLVVGVSIALGPKFSVRNFWKDVRDSESTYFVYVGETARYLLAPPPSPDDRNHKVRCMYGNGLRPDVWEQFRERFGVPEVGEFFNSTEGIFSLFNYNRGPFTAGSVGHHGLLVRGLMHNVFVPVSIDPETGDILRNSDTGFAVRAPYDQGGEILVSIPNKQAFQGYWQNDNATEKKFLRDVFKKGDLYYRSGDALRRQSDGRWYFLDRLGDTFRWKSENVATAEVSEVIGKFPGVQEANVYGVRLPNHEGRAGCAALQISPEARQTFDFAALARFARSKLPRYAVPIFLRIVDNPTHIHNHKQNKVPLREEGVDPELIGTKVTDGQGDHFLWVAPGNQEYTPFGKQEWQKISDGSARL
ncbi:Isopenicillin N epimerase component 1 [Penicillium macrosclerotiorum]|uniref:Isopenicillin N epimerase component 1 n=1 Tax=Penicillium macrosclerotiorum TaxID=303699 RepID=UPI002547D7DC|nr:Isopenicillin N epimerase component 1 [Penicillium macrosclerotiorum]KAJ5698944.1 Isopenicillin N epimerase component 1 [Penicillium macrosclerotiorum]